MPRQEPLAQQRRRISDRSKKDAMLSSLLVQPGIDNTITEGYLRFPGKFRLLVKGDLWTAWSQDTSKIPLYILEAISDEAHDMDSAPVMEVSEQIIDKVQNFVLEEISTKGIIFLQTSCNESEIAIPCTGRIAKGGHSLTILGPVQRQTQYLTDIPIGLLTEQVYNFQATSPSGPYRTGVRVKYATGLKTVDSTSSMVYEKISKQATSISTIWHSSVRGTRSGRDLPGSLRCLPVEFHHPHRSSAWPRPGIIASSKPTPRFISFADARLTNSSELVPSDS